MDVPLNGTYATRCITEAERLVDKINRVWNVVVYSVRPEDASFDNVILPLIRVENEASDTDGTIGHMSHVFPNPQLISGSLKARKLYLQAALARASRKDVYDLVQHVVNKDEALDPQSSF
ncbi:putative metallopeptidase [Phaeomoniella chlamydospora]|uniref:Putative metallopeptidase n=1 Tax=Phaeomoniella chlamydospora TaxID=158046 RepID=A0A0G2EQZ1_PHACM|nr:putative metallopeptidase [Phaeomoniella chlamydospora]